MRNRLDNILLGILWLLAATLGASFWFNTKYGFNIFSAPHWQYLAYLQASQAPVAPSFYISLGVCVFITIFGLYFLIQPKLRKIVFPIRDTKPAPTPAATEQKTTLPEPAAPVVQKSNTSEIVANPQITQSAPQSEPAPQPATTPKPSVTSAPTARPAPLRPPHLTLPTTNSYAAAPIPATTHNTTNNNDAANAALSAIFTQNGYTVKKNPYIAGWQPNLLAIGTNEVLWIGGIGATTGQVKKAINKLNQIFADTLDDIYIGINGFSINAPDAQTAEFNDILLFNTNDDLANYMASHKNPAPSAEEKENFDAYSEYIDTVIGYIGKL
ncbi:MAG: hypothetical protein K2M34_00245 [Alphaproteobacteria bacterium]|nr:hypothetical protein [Alphaproteobacteria bacterium]